MNDPASGSWHLDKRVPIAIILALIIQFFGALVAGSYTVARIEARISALESFVTDNKETRERLAVIELQLKVISGTLIRMESKLEK